MNSYRKNIYRLLAAALVFCMAFAMLGFTEPVPAGNSKYVKVEELEYIAGGELAYRRTWDTDGNQLTEAEYTNNRISSLISWTVDSNWHRPSAMYELYFDVFNLPAASKYDTSADFSAASGVETTFFYYDGSGSLVWTEKASSGENDRTTYDYDSAGNCVLIEYPDGSSVEYSFDSDGNLLSEAQANTRGYYIYSYSAQYEDGLLMVETESYKSKPEYELDIYTVNPNITSYKYDENGVLVEKEYTDGNNSSLNTTARYSYNASGLCTVITVFSGEEEVSRTEYGYSSKGSLNSVLTYNAGSEGYDGYKYSYDSSGNLSRSEYYLGGMLKSYSVFKYARVS